MNDTEPTKLFDMADGYGPVTNLLGMADPDVHRIGDQWCMFFNGLRDTMTNDLFCATLPPGAPLTNTNWSVHADESDRRRATPLVTQLDGGEWDRYGRHTPSYVCGIDPRPACGPVERERIYYAGRSSQVVPGPGGAHTTNPYSIGFAEKRDGAWVRHPQPILTGDTELPSVLEPNARYFEGMWRIWYVATADEPNSGESPQYRLQYVESENGVTNWSTPRVLFSVSEGYFDAAVLAVHSGYQMVASRHRTTTPQPNHPKQGLWWLTSTRPSGDRSAWTAEPTCILDADHGQPWHASGIHHPSIRYGDTPADRDTLYIFFNGIYHPPDPPFPAPFFCAIGRIQLSTGSAG